MAKNSFYLAAKRSEYRNNFLPFDYYDFWITAKENENLRCQNKIRDYVHTPFDWDEDQDYYLESNDKYNQATQATQTTERPRTTNDRKSRQKLKFDDKENNLNQDHHHARHHSQHQNVHLDLDEQDHKHRVRKEAKIHKKQEIIEDDTSSEQLSDDRQEKRQVKSSKNAGIQIYAPEAQTFNISKPRKAQSGFVKRSKSIAEPKSNLESKSITNMSVQTPPAWNLREYRNKQNKSSIHRSASASILNLKPKRAPFANYGWATRTKDLSNKPTHNALANKILASHNNKDAIIELTLQKIKKNANIMANEYSAIESHVAEKFHTGRSDSRAWNSEYLEKYPDHSRSPSKNEIYMAKNPYRLNKSSLINNYPPLRRGPKSAIKKVYYLE